MTEIQTFETGATRESTLDKIDYEGFLSPLVLERYGEYMHKNRFLKDGSIRDSDNWQKGMPLSVYIKSLFRHFMAVWKYHRYLRGNTNATSAVEDDLCGIFFNTQGYLHTILVSRGEEAEDLSSRLIEEPRDSEDREHLASRFLRGV